MAFDWNGTFTSSQFKRFRSYLEDQKQLIDSRITHLEKERERIGSLTFAYDAGGTPTHVTGDEPTTYIEKLFAAYEALGGSAKFDLQVRSAKQPVFRLAGDVSKPAQLLSNGQVIGVEGLNDAESALTMQALKNWVSQDLSRRRESLERKLLRAIDYSEQLSAEINELKLLKGDKATEGSLDFHLDVIDNLTVERTYMAITDDKGEDPHGKFAKAPVALYMPGKKGATATSYQRTLDGLAKPER